MKRMLFVATAMFVVNSVAYSQTTETKSATTKAVTPPAATTTTTPAAATVTSPAAATVTSPAATTSTTSDATNAKSDVALKKHVCTDDCHNGKGCVFKHGEEGHVCSDACNKPKHEHNMEKHGKEGNHEHMEKKPRKK